MIFDPSQYECPEHHTDLTSLVAEAFQIGRPPVAYFMTLLRRQQPLPEPFEVIVACPGANGSGTHSVTCSGKFTQ
jgi:hypothetical protein